MADFLDSEAEESDQDEEEDLDPSERKKLKKMKAMADSSEEDDEDDDDRLREELKDLIDDNPIEEDDASDYDDYGRPIAEKKKRRRTIFGDASLQEGQDIFGVDFDYEDFAKYDKDEYEEESDADDYEEDFDGVEREKRPKKATKKKMTKKSIFEIYEPSELKCGHFTDLDNEIRKTDIPERMQLRDIPIVPVPDGSSELEDEAEWIYKQAFCKPTVSQQETNEGGARDRGRKPPTAIGKIKQALNFMRNQQLEVPFIAFYRKEYVQPELNINDLWKVYRFDARWCQLPARKRNLLSLFEKNAKLPT